MSGVEILAAQEVAITYSMNMQTFYAIFITSALVMLLFVGFSLYKDIGFLSFLAGILAGAMFGSVLAYAITPETEPASYETQYKVTISDEVHMNEFVTKYEILSQEGRIYTVRSLEELND